MGVGAVSPEKRGQSCWYIIFWEDTLVGYMTEIHFREDTTKRVFGDTEQVLRN